MLDMHVGMTILRDGSFSCSMTITINQTKGTTELFFAIKTSHAFVESRNCSVTFYGGNYQTKYLYHC